MKRTLAFVSVIMLFLVATTPQLVKSAAGCTKEDFDKAVLAGTTRKVIYIGPDGSVEPAAAPIQRNGDKFTFTDDVYAPVIVDRNNTIIDGAGHLLQGPYNGTQTDLPIFEQGTNQQYSNKTEIGWSVGIDVANNFVRNLTVTNLNIKNFSVGIWLWTPDNLVTGNAISENILGILLSASGNTVIRNYVANNEQGIFFGANVPGDIPSNVTLSQNSLVDNSKQLSGCVCEEYNETEATHTWDNGEKGNYWSDYNGTDANKDGIGDAPYVIDVLNQDRFPLMLAAATPPTVAPTIPIEVIIVIVALLMVAIVVFLSKRKNPS